MGGEDPSGRDKYFAFEYDDKSIGVSPQNTIRKYQYTVTGSEKRGPETVVAGDRIEVNYLERGEWVKATFLGPQYVKGGCDKDFAVKYDDASVRIHGTMGRTIRKLYETEDSVEFNDTGSKPLNKQKASAEEDEYVSFARKRKEKLEKRIAETRPKWHDKKDASSCVCCNESYKSFGWRNRRTRCRACGKVAHQKCAPKRQIIAKKKRGEKI